ncbi:MAG TPA: ADP-ribosylation factor-like protein [Candidatus Bathyarchaeia archaeon]|nr:ADP-ribosylation factor-like protein [Candidatus Bathyarchaeia archaeon]
MQKILLIGLDGSGKTSLYQKFFQRKPIEQLKAIQPTRGIAKYEHDFLRTDFLILDIGGGKDYRHGYIGNAELVQGLSAIIFVVDVQAAARFQEVSDFFNVWIKSVEQHLKNVKGFLLFNKIDPGMEGKLKSNLEQIARLLAPIDSIYPGEFFKNITTIYNDSGNQTFQRILLDVLPKKMSQPKEIKPEVQPIKEQPISVKPPVVTEQFITQPIKSNPPQEKPAISTKSPAVSPPVLNKPPTATTTQPKIEPPSISKSPPLDKAQSDIIKEKTAERLSDIIEATLDNNLNFVAIAVFSDEVDLVVGAVQQGRNPDILESIAATLKKIDLDEYMSKLGKVRIGGEGHVKIDSFDIFFERVSPEHLSTVICSGLEEGTITNITQLNRYMNQALSITPEGVDDASFKRSDLMAELKMRLYNRGKSVDHVG